MIHPPEGAFDLWLPAGDARSRRWLVAVAADPSGSPLTENLAHGLAQAGFVVVVDSAQLNDSVQRVLRDSFRQERWLPRLDIEVFATVGVGNGSDPSLAVFPAEPEQTNPVRRATVLLAPTHHKQIEDFRATHARVVWGREGHDLIAPRALVLVAETCGDRSLANAILDGPLIGQRRWEAIVAGTSRCDPDSTEKSEEEFDGLTIDFLRFCREHDSPASFLTPVPMPGGTGLDDTRTSKDAKDLADWEPPPALRGVRRLGPSTWRAPRPLQFNLPLTAGIAINPGGDAEVAMGLRPEFLFLRRNNGSLGAGFYLDGSTITGFHSFQPGAGLSAYLPLTGRWGITPSAGLVNVGGKAGETGSVLLGGRQYNDISHFDMASGLRLEVRQELAGARSRTFLVELQVDTVICAALAAFGAHPF